ncbi:hypothetical protein [Actinacidiphila sp. bgisy160]|uniref:hypothetical protein n=1 Tax=Actinacidiphila sp. bgisy160 TaxID=3413796 RepID=UPI003D763326
MSTDSDWCPAPGTASSSSKPARSGRDTRDGSRPGAGTAAPAVGGRAAGALPVRDGIALPHGEAAAGLLVAYFGLRLLVAARSRLGRLVRGPRPPSPRALLAAFAERAAPLPAGPPLFGRDVYSYLAQGAMVNAGIDACTQGPGVLGGTAAAEVPAIWRSVPACPVTWVHHLMWVVPAPAAPAGEALRVLLCSSVVWLWLWRGDPGTGGLGALVGGCAYVWIGPGLLVAPRPGWRTWARPRPILADRVEERAG